jgi:hypothetical protein
MTRGHEPEDTPVGAERNSRDVAERVDLSLRILTHAKHGERNGATGENEQLADVPEALPPALVGEYLDDVPAALPSAWIEGEQPPIVVRTGGKLGLAERAVEGALDHGFFSGAGPATNVST